MKFTASYGDKVKIITLSATVLFLVLAILQIIPSLRIGGIFSLMIPAFLILILGIAWGFATNGYEVNSQELVIKRPFKDVIIQKKDMLSAEAVDRERLRFSVRVFGNGGLFGFYGYYANKSIRRMTWYATRLDTAVLIITQKGSKIILTPDERQKFIDALGLPVQ